MKNCIFSITGLLELTIVINSIYIYREFDYLHKLIQSMTRLSRKIKKIRCDSRSRVNDYKFNKNLYRAKRKRVRIEMLTKFLCQSAPSSIVPRLIRAVERAHTLYCLLSAPSHWPLYKHWGLLNLPYQSRFCIGTKQAFHRPVLHQR